MKRVLVSEGAPFIAAAVAAGALLGCASQQSGAVVGIEPPAAPGHDGRSPGSAPPASGDERAFYLSREPTFPQRSADVHRDDDGIHIGDKWWPFRSAFREVGEEELRQRDAAISPRRPPPDFWDRQTAVEAVSVWGTLCNQCHGGRRRLEDALSMPPPPDDWGQGQGLFFGTQRPYDAVFAIIHDGGPQRDDRRTMPAWRAFIAKEEIWALLYFLEYQSGGIEGRFPPSLYPRMQPPGNTERAQ